MAGPFDVAVRGSDRVFRLQRLAEASGKHFDPAVDLVVRLHERGTLLPPGWEEPSVS